MNAAAFARDNGVGRLVEHHEDGLDRRRVGLVAEADQLVDVDEREITGAGCDARDCVGRSLREIVRNRQALGREQAAARRDHEGRHARLERTVEGELDRNGWLCGLRRAFLDGRTCKGCEAGDERQHEAIGGCLDHAHRTRREELKTGCRSLACRFHDRTDAPAPHSGPSRMNGP